MEKDKNAEIRQLQKQKEIRETANEKDLKQINANLEEELKTKEKRYVLLLQQLESLHREKTVESKEHEVKLVTELLSKNSEDTSSKALQDTLNNIMNRLNDLENKPPQSLATEMLNDIFLNDKKDEGRVDTNQNE
jgi:preprotein translocase subunit SecD